MNAIIEQLTAINTAVTAAALQVIKAKDEVVAKITALEDALANGAITPEVQAALNALKGTVTDLEAAAQAIDNVVPDAPPPAPAG